jgi:hypothetical protein
MIDDQNHVFNVSTKEFGWIRHKEFGNFQCRTLSEGKMMTRITFGMIYCLAGMEICVMMRLVQTLEEVINNLYGGEIVYC